MKAQVETFPSLKVKKDLLSERSCLEYCFIASFVQWPPCLQLSIHICTINSIFDSTPYKVTREEQWGTTGTTGASILGGVLTVAGGIFDICCHEDDCVLLPPGALTIAAMTAAAPLLVAGTVVGVAGGLGGIAKNILVGKKKSAQQSGAELAMENLRKLEEAGGH